MFMDRERLQMTAVHMATQKLSSSSSVDETLREVLHLCAEAVGAEAGTIYIHDPDRHCLEFRHVLPEDVRDRLPGQDIPDTFGTAGRAFQRREPVITLSADAKAEPMSEIEKATAVEVRTMLTAPLAVPEHDPIGVVQLINKTSGEFDQRDLEILETVGAVSAMAYINANLTEQAKRMATLMGMGKVSHDIGNLASALHSNLAYLSALLGFEPGTLPTSNSHMLKEACDDMSGAISRIVSYSHLMSDLSAGKPVRPTLESGIMTKCVADAASYLEPEGRKHGVKILYEIDRGCETCMFDRQFVFRIVQNLVGNAIKAVRDANSDRGDSASGTVIVRCKATPGGYTIEVQDSGKGIPEAAIRRILAGNAISQWDKSGGSGWGTKIVLELAAALGGKMEIQSEPGTGATFRVFIPSEPVAARQL
jgi:signal transduction histidine kinase